jgi:DNA/RNA endonuclease G (NUC1)
VKAASKSNQPNGYAFEEALGTRWDRGHLVPNSDMPILKMKAATFNIINRAPQLAKVNQGTWRQAEQATKEFSKRYHKNLIIITTLVYEKDSTNGAKTREKRGGASVDIPLSYNKIVYEIDNRVESSITLARAACITQSNRDVKSQAIVLSWKDCPEGVKNGFPEPRDIEDDSTAKTLAELLRQVKSI